jgi:hypothetical protein
MSPAVWSVDGVSACMLYSMVECRALDSRIHPWPSRAIRTEPLCSVQRMKVRGLWGPLSGGWNRFVWQVVTVVKIGHAFPSTIQAGPCPKPPPQLHWG